MTFIRIERNNDENYIYICTAIFGAIILSACSLGPKSSYGFTLPDGNAELGQAYFVEYRCVDCHTVAGIEDIFVAPEGIGSIMNVQLGGETTHIKTCGELVTSIITPSHKVSEQYRLTPWADEPQSMMRNYNTIMTVDELIDIVAFVQAKCELAPMAPTVYKIY